MTGKRIGYIRVSTVCQNTERQLHGLELDKVFEDKCSGRTTERPRLQECLAYLREGDVLYVHSIDRLGRNIRDLLNLVNEILAKDVSIVFCKEHMTFDPEKKTSPTQMLYLNILSAVAEFEVSMIRERQREGIKLAQERNAYRNCGRKPSLTAEQAEEARRMRHDGVGVAQIAKTYNVSRQTIYTLLKAS